MPTRSSPPGNLSALPGRALAGAVVVRVVDAEGRAVAGVTVSFAPAAGHGEADPASAATGPDGRAASVWTLDAGGPSRRLLRRRRQPGGRRGAAGRDPRPARRTHRRLLRAHGLLRRLGARSSAAATGRPRDLTAVAHLDSTIIAPYLRGDLTLPEARLEIIRRSAVLFAGDLPAVQLHHGTEDGTVSVSQAESLVRTMEALGRTPPDFEAFIYPGGGHDILSLGGAIPRAGVFLGGWLNELFP